MLQNRSHNYDNLPFKLKNLALMLSGKDNNLKKARETGSLENYLPGVIEMHHAAEQVGVDLQLAFNDLCTDFHKEVINQAMYKAKLKEFSDFFNISDLQKSDLPKALMAEVILAEISRYV